MTVTDPKKPKSDKAIAAAIKKGIKKEFTERESEASMEEQGKAHLMSLINEAGSSAASATAAAVTGKAEKATILKSILKKAAGKS